jgi:hypothetical protein
MTGELKLNWVCNKCGARFRCKSNGLIHALGTHKLTSKNAEAIIYYESNN